VVRLYRGRVLKAIASHEVKKYEEMAADNGDYGTDDHA
jgi:hypothetical protein